jgi:hypothetical protein
MLTASQSQLSALGARRRKVEESDAGAIYRFILARLRQENLLSAIEEEDWGEIAAKVVARARLPAVI